MFNFFLEYLAYQKEQQHYIVSRPDSEFNKILNAVISKGYVLLNPSPNAHGDFVNMQSVFTRTWFLSEK